MNTQRTFFHLVALALLVGLSACATAKPEMMSSDKSVEIEAAYFRSMAAGQATTVGTFTVTASQPDRLVGVSSPDYRVELHRYDYQSGMTQMVPVDGLTLSAGETVELSPKGYHLLLIEPSAPLAAGDQVTLTLNFERSGDRTIQVPVSPERPLTEDERMHRPLD